MDLPHSDEPTLDDALERLRVEGGPLPVTRAGQVVAMILTPEELEKLEDALDSALIRAARAEPKEERITLEALAAELGVRLPA